MINNSDDADFATTFVKNQRMIEMSCESWFICGIDICNNLWRLYAFQVWDHSCNSVIKFVIANCLSIKLKLKLDTFYIKKDFTITSACNKFKK